MTGRISGRPQGYFDLLWKVYENISDIYLILSTLKLLNLRKSYGKSYGQTGLRRGKERGFFSTLSCDPGNWLKVPAHPLF